MEEFPERSVLNNPVLSPLITESQSKAGKPDKPSHPVDNAATNEGREPVEFSELVKETDPQNGIEVTKRADERNQPSLNETAAAIPPSTDKSKQDGPTDSPRTAEQTDVQILATSASETARKPVTIPDLPKQAAFGDSSGNNSVSNADVLASKTSVQIPTSNVLQSVLPADQLTTPLAPTPNAKADATGRAGVEVQTPTAPVKSTSEHETNKPAVPLPLASTKAKQTNTPPLASRASDLNISRDADVPGMQSKTETLAHEQSRRAVSESSQTMSAANRPSQETAVTPQISAPAKPMQIAQSRFGETEERSMPRQFASDDSPTAPEIRSQVDIAKSPSAAAPNPTQTLFASAPGLANLIKETKADPLQQDGDIESLHFDLRGTTSSTSTQTTAPATAMNRADMPRAIAMQIADAVRAMPDRPVDVSLNPEELGRVRLSVSATEAGVMLSVLAERPETLELMKRHAEQLARDLADMGFDSVELSFGKGQDGTAEEQGEKGASGSTTRALELDDVDPAQLEPQALTPNVLDTGHRLDIRL